MGQRLNIEIHFNGEALANAYYHWSGFTSSAITITNEIIDNLSVVEGVDNNVLAAIKLLESTGAKLLEEEYKFLDELGISEESIVKGDLNRNEGLISISEVAMDKTREYEEAGVVINLSENHVEFNAMYVTNFYDETEEQMIEVFGEDYENIIEANVPFANSLVPLNAFHSFGKDVLDIIEFGHTTFRLKGTEYYVECIE